MIFWNLILSILIYLIWYQSDGVLGFWGFGVLEIAIVTVVAVAVWIVTPWTQCASMVTTTAIACAVQMNDLNLWSIKIMCRQRREMRRNWWLIIRFKRKWPEDLPITLNSSSSFELMSKDSTSHMVISGEQEIIILT